MPPNAADRRIAPRGHRVAGADADEQQHLLVGVRFDPPW